MTLKTSSRKLNPFFKMLMFTLRKNFGIIIVLSILALLYCPGSYLANYGAMASSVSSGVKPYEFTQTFCAVISVFAPIFVVLFNFINFSFLYKKSASDVFHAFPLTRAELLISRTISGIIASLIPIFLCVFCYSAMVIFNPWLGNFVTLLQHIAEMLVITLIWSSFSLIFVVCAGSMFDLALSFCGINLATVFISLIYESIIEDTVVGYISNSDILYNLSLPVFCFSHKNNLEFWIRSIVYIVVFTTVAILLYNKRKAEKGGSAYAYKFMYLLCSVFAGICGGYLIGILFNSHYSSVIFWFFATIGAIISCVIYGLITNRGFKGVSRSILMGAIAISTMLAVMIIGVTGGLGYTRRVPIAQKIEQVTVEFEDCCVTFTNPELVIELHNKTIENASSDIDYSNDHVIITFDYKFKIGSSMKRYFCVPREKVEKELLAIYKSNERYEQIKDELFISSNMFRYAEAEYRIDSSSVYRFSYMTKTDCQNLLDAYWKDVQNLNDTSFFNNSYKTTQHLTIDIERYDNEYNYLSFYVGDTFPNTFNYMSEMGYLAFY
ncbi:MAG: hypothetical protein IKU82_01095 [Clostridia bacterium]|nr:hypothetical protein [Clostridia bacterium]